MLFALNFFNGVNFLLGHAVVMCIFVVAEGLVVGGIVGGIGGRLMVWGAGFANEVTDPQNGNECDDGKHFEENKFLGIFGFPNFKQVDAEVEP